MNTRRIKLHIHCMHSASSKLQCAAKFSTLYIVPSLCCPTWYSCIYYALMKNSRNPLHHLGLHHSITSHIRQLRREVQTKGWARILIKAHQSTSATLPAAQVTCSFKTELFFHGKRTKSALNTIPTNYTYLIWIHIIRSRFEPGSHITRSTPARPIRRVLGTYSRRLASKGLHSTSWRIRVPKRAAIRPLRSKVRPVHVSSSSPCGVYTRVRMSSAKFCRESRISGLMIHRLAFK